MVRKNVDDNAIYVSNGYGTAKQYGRVLNLDEMHFISGNPWPDVSHPVAITFKNRHTPVFTPGTLQQVDEHRWVINSDNDVQGIAPGQFAVIYDAQSHLCYGSGVITA